MGLDSYLNAKRFFWYNEPHPVIEGHEVKEVIVEAAYWRKANQIHAWFVENVQGGKDECQPHYVSRDQLGELLAQCTTALNTRDSSLLEPRSGFFFGGTDVNDYYWETLENTVKKLTEALEKFGDRWEFEYRSSW